MATPDFILELRQKIGTQPLWLSGITAVVLDEVGERVLLVKRADILEWTPITGIIDPGEQPAEAAIREAREEADVVIRVEKLAAVDITRPVTYANGDRAQYLDLNFLCRYVSGDPAPADGENVAAEWFTLASLPPMRADYAARIEQALAPGDAARFTIAAAPADW
ncbi:MAG: NUDIX domain-containing protein [Actinomycetota bacterium]|nr:NUDIX domain-containing protein [Actinomycetota bacterium]